MRIATQKEIRTRARAMGLYLPLCYIFLSITILALLTIGLRPTVVKIGIGTAIIAGTYTLLLLSQDMRLPSTRLPDKIINN